MSKRQPKLLLIDGDVLAYQATAISEIEQQWSDDVWTTWCDHARARDQFDEKIARIKGVVDFSERMDYMEVWFSGDGRGWRKDVLETYKANRKGQRKPAGYRGFVDELLKERQGYYRAPDGVEADDMLGVQATVGAGSCASIIGTIDKDLQQIPCGHLNTDRLEEGVHYVTPEQGLRFHMIQTLMGDRTDGYDGCPGVGAVTAAKLLGDETDPRALWDIVVSAFEKKGLSEAVVLQQARVAKICDVDWWDFAENLPVLWDPPETAVEVEQ